MGNFASGVVNALHIFSSNFNKTYLNKSNQDNFLGYILDWCGLHMVETITVALQEHRCPFLVLCNPLKVELQF